jgi:uncharacterized protein YjiS (DUF1127 family)
MTTRTQFDFPAASGLMFRGVPATGLLPWIHSTVTRWRERRVLEMLDERTLRDIGISRSQALAEARKPCWRR